MRGLPRDSTMIWVVRVNLPSTNLSILIKHSLHCALNVSVHPGYQTHPDPLAGSSVVPDAWMLRSWMHPFIHSIACYLKTSQLIPEWSGVASRVEDYHAIGSDGTWGNLLPLSDVHT